MKRIIYIILLCIIALPLSAQRAKRKTTTASKAKTVKVDSKTKLQNEKADTQRRRKLSQQQAQQLQKNIKANLDSVLILDNQISRQSHSIDSLNGEITTLSSEIDTLTHEMQRLEKQLKARKSRYARVLVMQHNRQNTIQQRLSFIFSADNFTQLLRRMRYMNEYTTYQKAQGKLLQDKEAEVQQAQNKLLDAKSRMQTNLNSMQTRQQQLQSTKNSCQSKVTFLNKNLASVQKQIKDYQAREQALADQIDRLVQAEIEAQRRAEAERRKKAEEARRRAEEEARRKAATTSAAKTTTTASKTSTGKSATASRTTTKSKSTTTTKAKNEPETETYVAPAVNGTAIDAYENTNRRLSSNFAANKGRLPMPVTGSYSVVGHYGNYTVEGLRNVTLNNRGIDIRANAGASARAIFDGEVSSIFQYGGTYIVMLRHGSYISVYSGLASVGVHKGQTVHTRDNLGAIAADADGRHTLHFQLRNESTRLNPEQWVR